MDIDPFSKQEREVVIEAFQSHPKYNCYAPFVQFLFLTGCRTSEAIGLKWKHINVDCSKITFCEAVVSVPSGRIRKGLKNQDKRVFPCNKQLQSFLLSIRTDAHDEDSPVFTSMKGNEVNICTFYSVWHGGKHYEKQYVGVGRVCELVYLEKSRVSENC
jgi:integrase